MTPCTKLHYNNTYGNNLLGTVLGHATLSHPYQEGIRLLERCNWSSGDVFGWDNGNFEPPEYASTLSIKIVRGRSSIATVSGESITKITS